MVGARLFPVRNLLFTLEIKNYLVEESFGPHPREYIHMAESGSAKAQPRFRDVIATLRPQVMFWWGTGVGVLVSGIGVIVLFLLGVLTTNTSGLVSLDSEKVALRIQLELEEAGYSTTVQCPNPIAAPIGFMFQCVAQDLNGNVAKVEVAITNVLGDINWNLRTELPSGE
jgi:hypothetical protein